MIVKTVVTGLSALWNARMFRSGTYHRFASALLPCLTRLLAASTPADPQIGTNLPSPPINLEPDLLVHVLSFYRILLRSEEHTSELQSQ